jgi:uncharacterized protein
MTSQDELNAPLGVGNPKPRRTIAPYAWLLAAALLGLVLTVFVAWSLLADDPLGGEPIAIVAARSPGSAPTVDLGKPAERTAPARTATSAPALIPPSEPMHAEAPPPPRAPAGDPTIPGEQIVTIIDGKSGARQEVRIPATGGSLADTGSDNPLVEMTRHGPIPRIGPDGTRAAQAYARSFQAKPNSPQIAIVISSLGISAAATAEAMNKLPGAVTFAFAPYGTDLERLTAKARSLGHELLLQVPMEPFDYPDNDPGPQTLLSSLSSEQNIDRLQWAMSRFKGYVGVSNQMGARFSASELSFSPIMREIGRRGLIYVDDGSSPRSLASQIAGGNSLAFVKANLTLDAVPAAAEVDRALSRLEAMARDNGVAVGFAAALPISIERISAWAKTAEGRGFTLVPITAAAARSKAS